MGDYAPIFLSRAAASVIVRHKAYEPVIHLTGSVYQEI